MDMTTLTRLVNAVCDADDAAHAPTRYTVPTTDACLDSTYTGTGINSGYICDTCGSRTDSLTAMVMHTS